MFTVLGIALLGQSRLAYAPSYLCYFDNVNFALAIRHFDPRLHQPQPPGYPLFVALLKALSVFLPDPNRALEASGLIGSAAALILVWLWASRMFGNTAGWISAALLFVHPVFWAAGIVNPVRTFLVVIAGATAVLSWMSMTEEDPRPPFFAMSCVLGLLAGFRPETLLLMAPLWLGTGCFRRLSLRTWIAGSAMLLCAALVWLVPLVVRTGGIESTYRVFFDYLRANSREYTLVFGAGAKASIATVERASLWNFGLTIAWIWAVPFALRPLRNSWSRAHSVALLCSFVPPFLFHALVHVRDVDQTLISIPVLCVAGGAVLANLRPRAFLIPAVALAVLISAWNFRRPMFRQMGAASRGAIRYASDWTRSTFGALDSLPIKPNVAFIWDDSVVAWRQVSYYYPGAHLLDLRRDSPTWILAQQATPALLNHGAILVPGVTMLVLGVSYQQAKRLEAIPGATQRGPLVLLPWGPGAAVTVGHYILRGRQ